MACDYIIPPQLLCGEIISVCVKSANNSQILGCPICISNGNYERNALIFNVCFIFDSNKDIKCYKPIIKKLNNIIKKMEIEYNFLSDNTQKVLYIYHFILLANTVNDTSINFLRIKQKFRM